MKSVKEMASGSKMLLHVKREEEDQMKRAQLPVVPPKKRRNHPDVDTEVIALSPTTLMAKNKYVCEVCFRGFPREQNLELHKRGHNLPWQLKHKSSNDEVKRKMYVCPVPSCVHHNPSNALGDLTGIKKHYSRKHSEKKYKCKKCTRVYAVDSDLKAHSKTCNPKEYQCHCGTFFSRRDRFISHGVFCKALGEIKYSHTSSAMGCSSKSTTNRNNPSLTEPVTHSGSQVSSIQNLTSNSLGITQGESRLNQISLNNLMNKPSIDLNCYKPSQAFVTVPSQQENKHKSQGNVNTKFFTNLLTNTTTPCKKNNFNLMRNVKNYENNDGSSLYSVCGSVSDLSAPSYLSRLHTVVTPQLSATTLLEKARMIGSTSSNTSATTLSRAYASSSLSGPTGGTRFEVANFLVDSKSYDDMDELVNPFSNSGNGSSNFTQYAGATYEQEDSYQDQLQNIGSKISFQQSRGPVVTRDFLGLGSEIVADQSSDGPQNG